MRATLPNTEQGSKFETEQHSESQIKLCSKPDISPLKEVEHLFFNEKWRSFLCRCKDCLILYSDIMFILQAEEENEPLPCARSSPSNLVEIFSHLDRTTQIEGIHAYNHFKSKLHKFLQKFADCDSVVTDRDVSDFFEKCQEERYKKRAKFN